MSSHSPTPAGAAPDVALPPEIRAFLETPRYATIATVNADGSPHLAFVWFLLDGDTIVINSRTERIWPRNLQRDPRIHLGIRERDDEDPDRWVGIKGRAEVIREGEPAVEDIQAMARRYGDDPVRFAGQSRISFAIRPERTFHYGG
jgi:PPOX class probable F420-dependent enzyme